MYHTQVQYTGDTPRESRPVHCAPWTGAPSCNERLGYVEGSEGAQPKKDTGRGADCTGHSGRHTRCDIYVRSYPGYDKPSGVFPVVESSACTDDVAGNLSVLNGGEDT